MVEGKFRPKKTVELDLSKVKGRDSLGNDEDAHAKLSPSDERHEGFLAEMHAFGLQSPPELKSIDPLADRTAILPVPEMGARTEAYRLDLAFWRGELKDWSNRYFREHPSLGGADSFADVFSIFRRLMTHPHETSFPTLEENEGRASRRLPGVPDQKDLDPERAFALRADREFIYTERYPNELAERIFGLRATDPSSAYKFERSPIYGKKGGIPNGLGEFYFAAELAEAWSKDAAEILPTDGALHQLLERPIAPMLDIPSPALERINEKHCLRFAKAEAAVEELVKELEVVYDESGERAMLDALVARFYDQTKYAEGKNSLLDIFAEEEGEADCEGRAKAMAVVLERLGFDNDHYDSLKFELFSDHVRLLIQVPEPDPADWEIVGGLYRVTGGDTFVLEGEVKKWEPSPGASVVSTDQVRRHLLFGVPLEVDIVQGFDPRQDAEEPPAEGEWGGVGGSELGESHPDRRFHVSGNPFPEQQRRPQRDINKTSKIVQLRVPSALRAYGSDDAVRRVPNEQAEGKPGQTPLEDGSLHNRPIDETPRTEKVGALMMSIKERLKLIPAELWGSLKGSTEGIKLRKEYAMVALLAINGGSPEESKYMGEDVADAAMEAAARAYQDARGTEVVRAPKAKVGQADHLSLFDKHMIDYWATTFDSIDYIVRRDLANLEKYPAHLKITPGMEERSVTSNFWELVWKDGVKSVEFLSPDSDHPLTADRLLEGLPVELEGSKDMKIKIDGQEITSKK